YPSNLVATFQGNQHNGSGGAGLEFYGSAGTLYLDPPLYEFTPARPKKPTGGDHAGPRPRGHFDTPAPHDNCFLRAWVDSVHSRKPPLVNVEMAIHAAGAAHLGNLAYRKAYVAKWPA